MAQAAISDINLYATFRRLLAYPDEWHLERFREIWDEAPASLDDLRAQYLSLFEAGLPQPKCPLLESAYVDSRAPGEVVLENKLFYKHFGLQLLSQAPADHLLTQLEFLSWLEHCIDAGNEGPSLRIAQREFTDRHLIHWLPRAAAQCRGAEADGYADILDALLYACKDHEKPDE